MIYNTRIAPSPSGNLHIGTTRTAYLNFLAARTSGGKFYLRIDDTDASRSNDIYTKNIIDSLAWLNIDYDDIFHQSQRTDLYKQKADDLLKSGKAIIIDGALCLNVDKTIDSWTDSVNGTIKINDDDFKFIKNLVLIKSNGQPTYHFASVVDDIDKNINFIIRGTDHISNTAKHVYLYDVLKQPLPKFAHIGLIHDKSGKKISKRDGADSVLSWKTQGYSPDAVLNLLMKMGWSHTTPNFDSDYPLLDRQTALKVFAIGKLRSAPSKLDIDKLDYYDKKYKKLKMV